MNHKDHVVSDSTHLSSATFTIDRNCKVQLDVEVEAIGKKRRKRKGDREREREAK